MSGETPRGRTRCPNGHLVRPFSWQAVQGRAEGGESHPQAAVRGGCIVADGLPESRRLADRRFTEQGGTMISDACANDDGFVNYVRRKIICKEASRLKNELCAPFDE